MGGMCSIMCMWQVRSMSSCSREARSRIVAARVSYSTEAAQATAAPARTCSARWCRRQCCSSSGVPVVVPHHRARRCCAADYGSCSRREGRQRCAVAVHVVQVATGGAHQRRSRVGRLAMRAGPVCVKRCSGSCHCHWAWGRTCRARARARARAVRCSCPLSLSGSKKPFQQL